MGKQAKVEGERAERAQPRARGNDQRFVVQSLAGVEVDAGGAAVDQDNGSGQPERDVFFCIESECGRRCEHAGSRPV